MTKGGWIRYVIGKAGDAMFELMNTSEAKRMTARFIKSRHDIIGKVTLDIFNGMAALTRKQTIFDGPNEAEMMLIGLGESRWHKLR